VVGGAGVPGFVGAGLVGAGFFEVAFGAFSFAVDAGVAVWAEKLAEEIFGGEVLAAGEV